MNWLRAIAERALRDQTRTRRLTPAFGSLPITVSSAGGLAPMLKPMAQVDPELFGTLKALVKPGTTVWDVGANLGLFSVGAAALSGATGQVVSFEPDTALVALLRRTAALQPDHAAAMTIVPCGVAGTTGFRSFAIASRARASNALSEYGNSQSGGARELQTIACFSLDDLLAHFGAPQTIKIDVEGAEVEVLNGAKRMLSAIRPLITCETAPQNSEAVTAILHANGYDLYDGVAGFLAGMPTQKAAWNTIAVPKN